MLLLVLCHVFFTSVGVSRAASITCETTCGSQCYNPNEKLCCGETLIDSQMTSRLSCCSGKLYDKTLQTCCGNTLIAVPVNDNWHHSITSHQRCCGGIHVYDVTMDICCADVVQRRHIFHRYAPSGEELHTEAQCCGNITYDESTEVCCEDDLSPATHFSIRQRQHGRNYRCCQSRVIDIESEECSDEYNVMERSVVDPVTTCNNNNIRDHICCNGKPYSLAGHGPDTKCCGSTIHDASRSLCCSGVIVNVITGNEMCCPHAPLGYVNSTTHLCCGGHPHRRRRSSSSNDDVIVCCGNEAIDVRYQSCCHDFSMAVASPYVTERQRCCGGHVTSFNTTCCGNRWPMTESDVCCGLSGLIARRNPGDNACCESRFRDTSQETARSTYNSETQVCLDGEVVARRLIAMCSGRAFNTVTHVCCSGIGDNTRRSLDASRRTVTSALFQRLTNNDLCCGVQLYNPRRQSCRNGHIRNITDMTSRQRARRSRSLDLS